MSEFYPSCVDFMVMYGAESYITEDFVQVTTFKEGAKELIILTDSADYIDVRLFENGYLITNIYDEGIERITLADTEVRVFFKNDLDIFDNKSLKIGISPSYSIELVTMLS